LPDQPPLGIIGVVGTLVGAIGKAGEVTGAIPDELFVPASGIGDALTICYDSLG
jgi:hypothetical protein